MANPAAGGLALQRPRLPGRRRAGVVAAVTEDLRPTQAPLRYHNGKLQEEYVVTRYDPEKSLQRSGQVSQTVEWRDVK
jgi:hypothetical protein